VLLILDVLLNDRQRCAANRRDEITVGPQSWQAAFNEREVLTQLSRTQSLDFFDQPVYAVLWVYIDQQVDMIGHHFQLDQISVAGQADTLHDSFKGFIGTIHQNGPAVLWTPHNVVLAGENDVAI
jgi:hypothetical protein